MLLKGLPPTALSRTPPERRGVDEPWTAVHELLAQLIEVTSIPAAERRLNEPITVPRPGRPTPPAAAEPGTEVTRAADQAGSNEFRRAVAAMGAAPKRNPTRRPDDQEESQT